jgi:hypothetical protein
MGFCDVAEKPSFFNRQMLLTQIVVSGTSTVGHDLIVTAKDAIDSHGNVELVDENLDS